MTRSSAATGNASSGTPNGKTCLLEWDLGMPEDEEGEFVGGVEG